MPLKITRKIFVVDLSSHGDVDFKLRRPLHQLVSGSFSAISITPPGAAHEVGNGGKWRDFRSLIWNPCVVPPEALYPGTKWVFPARSKKTSDVIATQVWKEPALPSETDHILRHTYRTVAQRVDVDPINRRLLLDHKVPGIDGVYVHERALFDKLLESQELVTAELLRLMGRIDAERPRRVAGIEGQQARSAPVRRMLPSPRG